MVLVVALVMVKLVRNFLAEPLPTAKKVAQQITLITPPPPPPPEVKPPEPEVKDEVKIDQPKPEDDLPKQDNDEPPPGADLGVDAEGGAGGDSFGLIGRKGGRGLLDGAGDRFAYYASQVQREIENALADDKDVRKHAYKVEVDVWLSGDGRVERAALASSTGSADTDRKLVATISRMPSIGAPPPPDMPQPVRMQVSSQL